MHQPVEAVRVWKVCLLGAFAVGKTSLVRRFVSDVFSDAYLTTIGVKIEKTELQVSGQTCRLVIWDIHGEDRFQHVDPLYMRGASGLLVVVDPTRPSTVESARNLMTRATEVTNFAPTVVVANKVDLQVQWSPEAVAQMATLTPAGPLHASAKTSEGVQDAFLALAQHMLRAAS